MRKNEINQSGSGNFAFTDIHDSEFNIFIGQNYQYNELLDQIRTHERLLSLTHEDANEERLEISQKIIQLEQAVEKFKRDVLQLAEQFNRTEINTDRLRRAKEFFENGEFGEARAVLETELEQLRDEQTRLLVKRDEYETDTLPKLKSNAEQFFILGLLTQLDYANPDWFADTCRYFEDSIRSYPTKDSVFYYAVFSWKHNRVAEAEKYYRQFLNDFASEITPAERAGALNNLGLLHWDSNEYEKGLAQCEEALAIFKSLSKDDPSTYLPEIAGTLNNLAMLHGELNDSTKSLKEYKKALAIYRELAESSSDYSFDIAKLLGNLGSINTQRKKYKEALAELEESLSILEQLAKTHSADYSFYIATTLHNLGVLYCAKKEYRKALAAYEEALRIRMNAARYNPSVYLPEASCTLSNLSFYYYKFVPNRGKSIEYALETVVILMPIHEQVPFTQRYLRTAISVLNGWDLSGEEIERLIEERMTDQRTV